MKKALLPLALASLCALPAQADEGASIDTLRQTTLNLIDALVDTGVLTRDKADELIKAAEAKAAKTAARAKKDSTVRVQYVPESVKAEIREQLKQEVLAQARTEGWATPNAIPEWTERIRIEGDLRVRYQADRFGSGNSGIAEYNPGRTPDADLYPNITRNPGAAQLDANGQPAGNVGDDVSRMRLRARLGVLAKINDTVSAGVRLATGNVEDRVSTNQTLGQNFNKYTLAVDRAYLKLDPVDWLSVSGGRIPNPWFNTDLTWDEDLNFEGVAGSVRSVSPTDRLKPFLTAGWFPLRADSPPKAGDRSLIGLQVGADWEVSSNTRLRFGLARFNYRNIEGRQDQGFDLLTNTRSADYGQYEYGANFRQKGNTLFQTTLRNGDNMSSPVWGLASRFEPTVLTFAADLAHFDPVHLMLSAEYIKNTGFDRREIERRTGLGLIDGKDTAWQVRLQAGMPSVRAPGEWQAWVAYRYLGSDAQLDAFVDSDFGLGGTNQRGYVLGGSYAVYRDTALGLRWYSAENIDSMTYIQRAAPFGNTLLTGQKLKVDTLMVDLNVRF